MFANQQILNELNQHAANSSASFKQVLLNQGIIDKKLDQLLAGQQKEIAAIAALSSKLDALPQLIAVAVVSEIHKVVGIKITPNEPTDKTDKT